jgi:HSP20 family protein
MSTGLRYPADLLAELQQHFEQAMRPASRSTSIRGTGWGAFPAIDVGTTPDTIEIAAFAPGLDASAVQVTIDKGLLTIAGERGSDIPRQQQDISVYAEERFSGAFRRVISLPEDADPAKVDATYQEGFLRISVGKRESSRPRRIEISGG